MCFKQRLSQRAMGLPANSHFHTVWMRKNTLLPSPAHQCRTLGHITGLVIPTVAESQPGSTNTVGPPVSETDLKVHGILPAWVMD